MKKVVKLSIIVLLMMLVFTAKVYAKPNCNISMQATQEEVEQGKEITIEVKLSNIQSERGIIAIEGTLEYEKDCLTLSNMEGQNAWDTPVKGLSYNETNGKFVIDKKGLAKNDEGILKITFLVNTTDQKDTTISINNMIVADGTAPTKIGNISKNITIKDKEEKPETKPTPDEEQKPNPTPNEEQKPNQKPTPSEEPKSNTEQTTSREQKKDTKPTTNEEQETNTNIIEKQETNTIEKEENRNKTLEEIENKSNHKTEKNNYVLIFVLALFIITVIIVVIIYTKRKNSKKKRR